MIEDNNGLCSEYMAYESFLSLNMASSVASFQQLLALEEGTVLV